MINLTAIPKLKELFEVLQNGRTRRIIAGITVNAIGKLWVILLQLIAIPVMSKAWGVSGLGIWIMVSTVPTYISLTSGGFSNVAATSMTNDVVRGEYQSARATIQSVSAVVTIMAIIILSMITIPYIIISTTQAKPLFYDSEIYTTILILSLYTIISIQTSLVQTVYRATKRYAQGTLFLDLIAASEGIGVIIVALNGFDMRWAAASMLLLRGAGTILYHYWIAKREPWYRISLTGTDLSKARRLVGPAFATIGMTAAQSISLQGTVVIIGLAFNPAVTASYATARTICRIPLQLSDLFNRATLPELVISFAEEDQKAFKKIILSNIVTTILVLFPAFVTIALFGNDVAARMFRLHITYDSMIFPFLSLSVLFQGIWVTMTQPLVATNRHHSVSFAYLVISTAVAFSPFLIGNSSPPAGTVACVVAFTEAMMVLVAYYSIKKNHPGNNYQ